MIYAIYYVAGSIAATIGPWPEGSMAACEQGRKEQIERFEEQWRLRAPDDPLWVVEGHKLKHDDFAFACENRAVKPELGERR